MADEPRPYPSNVEFERALLGGLILDPARLAEVADVVRPQDFYRPEHERLYTLLLERWLGGEPIDMVTVGQAVNARRADLYGGVPYVVELPDHVPATANLAYYAGDVRECADRRGVIARLDTLRDQVFDRVRDYRGDVGRTFADLAGELAPRTRDSGTYQDAFDDLTMSLEATWDRGDGLVGTPCGFGDVDHVLKGLQPGLLYILAARPSMGKSALALQVAEHVARAGSMVSVFSLEMTRDKLAMRSAAREGDFDRAALLRGDRDAVDRFLIARGKLRELAITVVDRQSTLLDVQTRVKAMRQIVGDKLGLVLVDYLQIMQSRRGAGSREQEVSEMSRGLKALAKDENVPVLALSQLSREVEKRKESDRRPRLSDLRESGAIEQDADVVLFLHREHYYDNMADPTEAELIVAKNRDGELGPVALKWTARTASFSDAGL